MLDPIYESLLLVDPSSFKAARQAKMDPMINFASAGLPVFTTVTHGVRSAFFFTRITPHGRNITLLSCVLLRSRIRHYVGVEDPMRVRRYRVDIGLSIAIPPDSSIS